MSLIARLLRFIATMPRPGRPPRPLDHPTPRNARRLARRAGSNPPAPGNRPAPPPNPPRARR